MSKTCVTLEDVLPRVLPAGWLRESVLLPLTEQRATRFVWERLARGRPLVVLATLDDHDAGVWLHTSTSRMGKLPTWDDLKLVHEVVHADRLVVQLMPPRSSWLSIADCLHLFERLDASTVPEALWRRP